MKNPFRVVATVVVATLAVGTLIGGLALTAHAAGNPPWEPVGNPPQAGGLLFFNSAGQQITGGSTTDASVAAYVEGTNTVRSADSVAVLDAYTPVDGVPVGQWSGEQLSLSTTFPNASAPAPLNTSALPVVTGSDNDYSLADYQQDFPNNDTSDDGYAGLYVLRLYTNAPGKTSTTSYDAADIQITGTTWSEVYPYPPGTPALTSTTTTLTASPSSPVDQGTSVTLTATVGPSAATGTVQFESGATDIGTPQTVTDGVASLTTTTLPPGASLTALFTADTGYTGSADTIPYTVTAETATTTTTTLTASPTSPQPFGTSVTLDATVSPSAATGTVQFESGGTDIGSPVTVTNGIASISTTSLPVGSDTLSAVFTPAQFEAYTGSTGSATYNVTAASFQISTTSLPDAVVGTPYSQQLATADSGSGTVKWKKVAALPKGFKVSSTGVLTGTPSAKATGPYSVDVSASLNKATPVTADIPLTVEEAPAFSPKAPLTTSFQDGTSSSFTIAATGYPAPTISESGSLPSGVTFDNGVLSGTPALVANTASYPLTITASNGVGSAASETVTLTAIAPLVIITSSLPAATPGAAYGPVDLGATGGESTYTWKKVGTLPKGLALSSAGVLSGTLSSKVALGSASVGVQVESKEGKTKVITSETFTLSVVAAS